ncbi:MAG: hypothetical protein QG604_542 [Candidatus Dependentiae bacterium]|nr:hypothetical protein [Candidatus Dependentiae bacterium]
MKITRVLLSVFMLSAMSNLSVARAEPEGNGLAALGTLVGFVGAGVCGYQSLGMSMEAAKMARIAKKKPDNVVAQKNHKRAQAQYYGKLKWAGASLLGGLVSYAFFAASLKQDQSEGSVPVAGTSTLEKPVMTNTTRRRISRDSTQSSFHDRHTSGYSGTAVDHDLRRIDENHRVWIAEQEARRAADRRALSVNTERLANEAHIEQELFGLETLAAKAATVTKDLKNDWKKANLDADDLLRIREDLQGYLLRQRAFEVSCQQVLGRGHLREGSYKGRLALVEIDILIAIEAIEKSCAPIEVEIYELEAERKKMLTLSAGNEKRALLYKLREKRTALEKKVQESDGIDALLPDATGTRKDRLSRNIEHFSAMIMAS